LAQNKTIKTIKILN